MSPEKNLTGTNEIVRQLPITKVSMKNTKIHVQSKHRAQLCNCKLRSVKSSIRSDPYNHSDLKVVEVYTGLISENHDDHQFSPLLLYLPESSAPP